MASTLPTVPRNGHRNHSEKGSATRAQNRTTDLDRRLIAGTAALAGLGAAFAGGEPTGLGLVDLVFRAAFAAVIVFAASRARRWTWIILAGVTAVASADGGLLVVSVVALAVAIVGGMMSRRRLIGAVSAAIAVQALLRLPDLGFSGASALVTVAAVVPVLVSGYLMLPRRQRRLVHRVGIVAAAFVVVSAGLFAFSVLGAVTGVRSGIDRVHDGLVAAGDGDMTYAAELFEDSNSSLESASSMLGAWWASPVRLVPGLAQQARALDEATASAADVSFAAGEAATAADFERLRYLDGRIDVEGLRAAQAPLDAAVESMDAATASLDAADSPWLLPLVRSRVDRFAAELDNTRDEVGLAALGARAAPGLVGGDGPRTYLVLFTQPAETRGLGGFIGGYAELRAENGEIRLATSGKGGELNRVPNRAERTISGPPDYLARYNRFRPAFYIQDVTLSPDFPSVAAVSAELYEQTTGRRVDGVIAVDPYGLEELLSFTGPISVDGLDRRLTEDNTAEFLIREQYLQFDRAEGRAEEIERRDVLSDVGSEAFDQLVNGDLPGPRRAGDVLGPVVAERHLMAHGFRPEEQDLFVALGAAGALEPPADRDAFMLVTQNKGNNKIDSFLYRSIDYLTTFDPSTGELEATATITLRNDAPADGLPLAIIGSNDQGLPLGTNSMFFSFYTPHLLREVRLDGEEWQMEVQREGGFRVYSRFLELAPGQSTTLELDLMGELPTDGTYELLVLNQPVVNPDELSARVELRSGWFLDDVVGAGVLRGTQELQLTRLQREPASVFATLKQREY
jgi:hypothetical protein